MSVVVVFKSMMGCDHTTISCLGSTALSVLLLDHSFCTTNLDFLTFHIPQSSYFFSKRQHVLPGFRNVGKSRTHDLFVSQGVIQSRKLQEEFLHNRL